MNNLVLHIYKYGNSTILILASIDRLLISSENVDTRSYSSKRLAFLLISISTVFWMIFNVHILIMVDIQQFNVSRQHRREIRSMKKRDFQLFRCLFAEDIVHISVSAISSFYNVYRTQTRDRERTELGGIVFFTS